MKYVPLILICCFVSLTSLSQTTLSANAIMKDAFALARKEKKNVFVKYSASWCGWCRKMDASMQDASCKKYFDDNYITVHLVVDESDGKKNLENPGADSLILLYNGRKNSGLPFWYILDANGKLLADCYVHENGKTVNENNAMIGCPATEKEVAAFVKVLKKTSTLSNAQESAVIKVFRKNEL